MDRRLSKHVGTLGDIAFHGYSLALNCVRLILAHDADYLLRKLVDRAVCKECGGQLGSEAQQPLLGLFDLQES